MNKEHNWVKTIDGQKIAFDQYKTGKNQVVILAPGFFNNKDAYLFKEMADTFSKNYDVITFDFRGHGKSTGLFSWTIKEAEDLKQIINYAKEEGYQRIGVVGFSLGAATTLIEASTNKDINSVISVSAPYDFWEINFHFWEEEMLNDLKLNLGMKGKGKGVRPGNPFQGKIRPVDIVDKISPTPILFIHGEKDWLIKPHHSEVLFKKAKKPKRLEIIKNAGHAEKIFDDYAEKLENLCVDWFKETL